MSGCYTLLILSCKMKNIWASLLTFNDYMMCVCVYWVYKQTIVYCMTWFLLVIFTRFYNENNNNKNKKRTLKSGEMQKRKQNTKSSRTRSWGQRRRYARSPAGLATASYCVNFSGCCAPVRSCWCPCSAVSAAAA